MKELIIRIWEILRDLWYAPAEHLIWLVNLLLPQILLLLALWLVFRWLWRKAYPPKQAKK